MGSMISGILGEIDDRWSEIFQSRGQSFTGASIVLFRNATNGGRCGMAQSAMGPFYCPPEKKIFLDTGFFREVETRFHGCSGSACKFTAAYIIAHEAGHHVQNLLGIIPRVTRLQQQVRRAVVAVIGRRRRDPAGGGFLGVRDDPLPRHRRDRAVIGEPVGQAHCARPQRLEGQRDKCRRQQ